MTREQAKQLAPFIAAWSEGKKTVQYRMLDDPTEPWIDCVDNYHGFNADILEYRIKPEPRRFWIEISPTGETDEHGMIGNAYVRNVPEGRADGIKVLRVIEVIEVMKD